MPPRRRKKQKWGDQCDAKNALYAALVEGQIPLERPDTENGEPDETDEQLKEYFNVREEVAAYGEFDAFRRRLNDIRDSINKSIPRAEQDKIALAIFVKNNPKHQEAATGSHPEWEGSDAQKQLKKDMLEGKHKTMPPEKLHDSNTAYDLFPLKVFREHIYQESRTKKFLGQLKKRGKGGQKWKDFRTSNNDNST